MSGGELEYIYFKLYETARHAKQLATTPLQRAFVEHLFKVAAALKAVEWLWSGDTGPGDEVPALLAVISKEAVLEQVTREAQAAKKEIEIALNFIEEEDKK